MGATRADASSEGARDYARQCMDRALALQDRATRQDERLPRSRVAVLVQRCSGNRIGNKPSLSIRDLGLAQNKVSGALAAGWLRRFVTHYRVRLNARAAIRMMLPVALRNFLLDYIRARDTEAAHTELRMEPASPNLALSPPGRQSSIASCPPPESSSDEQRGAKGACKKPKGSRLGRR